MPYYDSEIDDEEAFDEMMYPSLDEVEHPDFDPDEWDEDDDWDA